MVGAWLAARGKRGPTLSRAADRAGNTRPAKESDPFFHRLRRVALIFLAFLGLWGCGGGKDPQAEVPPQSGLERAKVILNDYAKGVPMGSEAITFEEIVEEVRKTDPQKATILEKGFAELKRAPGDRSVKARELLKKL
jgi:hypothetical protein